MSPSAAPAPKAGGGRRLRWAACALAAFVVAMVACRWNPETGFTSLLRFGAELRARQLPELKPLPVALAPGLGYDGQYYAQLAVSPDLSRPEMPSVLGNPAYRARRILFPLVAHVAGAGRPWPVLQVYALLNLAAWLWLAWLWWRECQPAGATGFARWGVAVLSLGALDSVRMGLTDLPATLFLVLAVRAARAARPHLAVVWMALAGLTRETAALAFAVIAAPPGDPGETIVRRLWRMWRWRALALAPVAAWSIWLWLRFPDSSLETTANFSWPLAGFARHLGRCAQAIASGDFDDRYLFGIVAALGLAWQSLHVLARWREKDPWIRMALPFALLFWVLGDGVWQGYWAAARVCLPLTFAFVRVAPVRAPFLLANLSLLHGVYRLLPGP